MTHRRGTADPLGSSCGIVAAQYPGWRSSPGQSGVHDAVKFVRDTMAKFQLESSAVESVNRTLGDVRAWGEKPLTMTSCNEK